MARLLPPANKKSFLGKLWDGITSVFTPTLYTAEAQRENVKYQVETNYELQQELQEKRQEFEFSKMKIEYLAKVEENRLSKELQWDLAKFNQEFLSRENALIREHQLQLAEYTKKLETDIQQKKLDFKRYIFEERKKLEIELLMRSQQFKLELTYLQNRQTRETAEYKKKLDKYPWKVYPSDILDSYQQYQSQGTVLPPTIVISPPSFIYGTSKKGNLKQTGLEKDLTMDVRNFLRTYYGSERPTKFMGGLLESNNLYGESAMVFLFSMFKSIPVILLESEMDENYLNFCIGAWDVGQADYIYLPVLSHFPYKEFLNRSAKAHAIKWQEEKAKLIQKNYPEEEINNLGGHNEDNLILLEREKKYKEDGLRFSIPFHITQDCYNDLLVYLRVLHRITLGLALDEYFFLKYGLSPKLPEALNEVLKVMPTYEKPDIIYVLEQRYSHFIESLQDIDSLLLPEWILEVVSGLSLFSNKDWLIKLINESMKWWLRLRKIENLGKQSYFSEIQKQWNEKDIEYAEALRLAYQHVHELEKVDILLRVIEDWQIQIINKS